MALTVLMDAGPWLPVPPPGYGGIENVVATLVPELRARGVRVVLASVGESALAADEHVSAFRRGRFAELARPYNRVVGVAHAHAAAVTRRLREGPPVDLVHSHVEVVGPAVLAALGPAAPPVLQTLHWDPGRHPDFYGSFDGGGRVWFAALSQRQLGVAPPALRRQVLATIPLAVPLDGFSPDPAAGRDGPVLLLARLTPVKGADLALDACAAQRLPLVLAGPVGPLPGPAELDAALADPAHPAHGSEDVAWFRDEIRPRLDGERARWIGTVGGAERRALLAGARAAVFPVRWEEPGATAAIEALASGTPVVALRRGALAEIVEHGVTGFLADDPAELGPLLARVGEIDRAACRRAAEERFSPGAMAERYLGLYAEVREKSSTASSA